MEVGVLTWHGCHVVVIVVWDIVAVHNPVIFVVDMGGCEYGYECECEGGGEVIVEDEAEVTSPEDVVGHTEQPPVAEGPSHGPLLLAGCSPCKD
jgi:hypothetical protein